MISGVVAALFIVVGGMFLAGDKPQRDDIQKIDICIGYCPQEAEPDEEETDE